jgi:hypothetical protein
MVPTWLAILLVSLVLPAYFVGMAVGRSTQRDEDNSARWKELSGLGGLGVSVQVRGVPFPEARKLFQDIAERTTELRLWQPGPDATVDEMVAWWDAKAGLHKMAAALDGPDADAEAGFGRAAHRYARRLEREAAEVAEVTG